MRRHDTQVLGAAAFGERVQKALADLAADFRARHVPPPDQKWVWSEVKQADDTIDQGSVSRWMNGKTVPKKPARILALARVLRVEPGWLLFGEEGCERPTGGGAVNAAGLPPTAPRPDEPARAPGKRSAGRRHTNER